MNNTHIWRWINTDVRSYGTILGMHPTDIDRDVSDIYMETAENGDEAMDQREM